MQQVEGIFASDGGAEITARGVCWSLNANPTTSDLKTNDGVGIGQFTSDLTGLNAGSSYHVRAYATNSAGTAYGSDIAFATSGQAPVVTTLQVCCITTTGATLNGVVNANDLSTTITFDMVPQRHMAVPLMLNQQKFQGIAHQVSVQLYQN